MEYNHEILVFPYLSDDSNKPTTIVISAQDLHIRIEDNISYTCECALHDANFYFDIKGYYSI